MLRELLQIYQIFFKIGATTFGGGYAMLPVLQYELVERRAWLAEQDIMDFFAVAQSLPGIIAVNVATLCGARRKGIAGSTAAMLGVITPSVLIILAIAMFISNFTDVPLVKQALVGINLAVAALLAAAVRKMGKDVLTRPLTVVIVIMSFIAVEVFQVPVVLVIVLSVAAVWIEQWVKRHD